MQASLLPSSFPRFDVHLRVLSTVIVTITVWCVACVDSAQRDGDSAADLVQLLAEAKQEVPEWLRSHANKPPSDKKKKQQAPSKKPNKAAGRKQHKRKAGHS
jgi:hypothetical protein